MAIKTHFSADDFQKILSKYDLGAYIRSEALTQGTVQTNVFLQTSQGKFVFRCYESRAKESVYFERDLLIYLIARGYPCPKPITNKQGGYVGTHHQKPYMIFAFIEGHHVEHPTHHQWHQLIQKVADLQRLTQDFHSAYIPYRWNYGPELCLALAQAEAAKLNTPDAYAKLIWFKQTLATLNLPSALSKCICHCDFHHSNLLFQGENFIALLDFDDANYTFPQFDLVGLMEAWAWPHHAGQLDLTGARDVVQLYMKHRPLSLVEQQSLFDVYKLSILIDGIWFFSRGLADNFYEKRKIDALTRLGRNAFSKALFQG